MNLFLLSCRSIDIIEKVTADTAVVIEEEALNFEDALRHLDALQEIADRNNNNRSVGTQGAVDTIGYLVEELTNLEYSVWTEDVSVEQYQENSEPFFIWNGITEYEAAGFYYSPKGEVTAEIQSVDVQIPPGNQSNSSDSGCEMDDFVDFIAGRIAVIQRGTCNFVDKAHNAQAAGASAVILFNEGQNDRQDVVTGTLYDNELTIPVLGTSYDWGRELAESDGATVTVSIDSEIVELNSQNVFAERDVGDEGDILLIGGHLDSVWAGPGINDNGSGIAANLAMAQLLATEQFVSERRIRFAFWTAEELGLIGSSHYVEHASSEELNSIAANLNFDMLASPNFVRFIYDGDGSDTSQSGPNGSAEIEGLFEDAFREQSLSFSPTSFDGRSDYGPFIAIGIPAGGLFSGAESIKDSDEALIYGGEAGIEYDKCYHQACDDRSNINEQGFEQMYSAIVSVSKKLSSQSQMTNRNRLRDFKEHRRAFPFWGEYPQQ